MLSMGSGSEQQPFLMQLFLSSIASSVPKVQCVSSIARCKTRSLVWDGTGTGEPSPFTWGVFGLTIDLEPFI